MPDQMWVAGLTDTQANIHLILSVALVPLVVAIIIAAAVATADGPNLGAWPAGGFIAAMAIRWKIQLDGWKIANRIRANREAQGVAWPKEA